MKLINNILIAIDGSDSSLNAANYAIKLAKQIDAQLEIIYIIKFARGNIDAGIFPADIEEYEKERAKHLIKEIKENHTDIIIHDIEIVGKPSKEINKVIKELNIDLLIIGHHAYKSIKKILNRSVEKNLLKHLKIPLLIIPKNDISKNH